MAECFEVSLTDEGFVCGEMVAFDPTQGFLSQEKKRTIVYDPLDPCIVAAFPNCILKVRTRETLSYAETLFSDDLKDKFPTLRGWCPQIRQIWKVRDTHYILEDKMKGDTIWKVLNLEFS
jgi:hypothetical protein